MPHDGYLQSPACRKLHTPASSLPSVEVAFSRPTHVVKEVPVPAKLKTILLVVVVIFLVYAIVRDPERAANVLRAIWDLLYSTVEGFGRFFASLVG